MLDNTYQYPWGAAESIAKAYAATMAAEVKNSETIVTVAQMTGAGTLNLTVNEHVRAGANLTVKVSADATGRTLTFGTGFTAAAYAITASKSVCISFKYDGTNFVQCAAPAALN